MFKKIDANFRLFLKTKFFQTWLIWIIRLSVLVGVVFLAVRPMRASQGMWYSFDDVQVIRTVAMVNELRRGQFPVRMLSDFGNGGGLLLFNFYSPLVYYLSAGLVLIGNHPLNAVKLAFQICYLVGAFGMLAWLKQLLPDKPRAAILGALLLIASSYFNYDAYVRGALAELAGFAIIPWVFWSYEYLKKSTRNKFGLVGLAVALSALIYAHVITAFIVLPFFALRLGLDWYFGQIKAKKHLPLVFAGLLTIGLSASYLLPLLAEKSMAAYSQITNVTSGFRNSFVSLPELLGWYRNTDPAIKPLTLGFWLSLGAGLATVIGWRQLRTAKKYPSNLSFWWFSVISLGLLLFIQSRWSWPLWANSGLLQSIQFPYRYLTIMTVLAIGLVCFVLSHARWLVTAVAAGLLLLALTWRQNQTLMTPSGYYFTDKFRAEDPCSSSTWQFEFFPKWMKECLPKGNSLPLAIGDEKLIVIDAQAEANQTSLLIHTNGEPGELVVSRYYFPGWQILSDQQNLETYPVGQYGLLGTKVAVGQTELRVRFVNTPIRNWANIISIGSLIIGLGLVVADSLRILMEITSPKSKRSKL
jgi:hypothetical protein